MDEFAALTPANTPTARRPLLGLTVLAVEDSRFASEALRLICLRSGARIRRADCLSSARRHLKVYRPAVAVVDLGLPDGSGVELIRDLATAAAPVPVILATSGDTHLARAARAAGADGFIAKPITSLSAFQTAVLAHLPADRRPNGLRAVSHDVIAPDPMAYVDDLAHAADVLGDDQSAQTIAYVAQFLSSIAQSAGDTALQTVTEAVISENAPHTVQRMAGLVQDRLTHRQVI